MSVIDKGGAYLLQNTLLRAGEGSEGATLLLKGIYCYK